MNTTPTSNTEGPKDISANNLHPARRQSQLIHAVLDPVLASADAIWDKDEVRRLTYMLTALNALARNVEDGTHAAKGMSTYDQARIADLRNELEMMSDDATAASDALAALVEMADEQRAAYVLNADEALAAIRTSDDAWDDARTDRLDELAAIVVDQNAQIKNLRASNTALENLHATITQVLATLNNDDDEAVALIEDGPGTGITAVLTAALAQCETDR